MAACLESALEGVYGGFEMNIAVLMTCHDRRDTTLTCLCSLEASWRQVGGDSKLLDVYLVDDGSADGTASAVESKFEVNVNSGLSVHLIEGNGNLYWAKGMALAWHEALKNEAGRMHKSSGRGFRYDCFLWLNDDAVLNANAFSLLLNRYKENPRAILNGTLVDSSGKEVYGYNVQNSGLAGNCVLVPRGVYERVGMICGEFSHGWADRDYGLRVQKAGIPILSAGIVGMTEWHPHRPSLKGLSFSRRVALLKDPKGWNVHDLWLLRRRNWGICAAVVSCIHLILYVVVWGER